MTTTNEPEPDAFESTKTNITEETTVSTDEPKPSLSSTQHVPSTSTIQPGKPDQAEGSGEPDLSDSIDSRSNSAENYKLYKDIIFTALIVVFVVS